MIEGVSSGTDYDVVIVGGGPSGSTCGTLLKKYNPGLRVLIIEKEKFPRDHIGESQLPGISIVLNEMGVWDKVEAAGFPIKIGASFTWGRDDDQWDLDFFPAEKWQDEPRPGRYAGQRLATAFQVNRAEYDEILLRHAESMGVEVREQVKVDEVLREGDRVQGFRLSTGEVVTGRYYIDGSGVVGLLRRAMGVESWAPLELRNIAIWNYWEDAQWAVEIGTGATRIQIRSLPYGWIWFIPIGPTLTSVGLVCPSKYYKSTGISPEELYLKAIDDQAQVKGLMANARPAGEVQSCRDWSHLSERLVGENWFLLGEAGGFADPILSAGMHLAHQSARHVAYTILELDRGMHDGAWLKERYNSRLRSCIQTHIRFAQFWYSANGCFTDIKECCQGIAKEAGLKLNPGQAWRWLAQGGFVSDNPNKPLIGLWDVEAAKGTIEQCLGKGEDVQTRFLVDDYNDFTLNMKGAKRGHVEDLVDGRIQAIDCFLRDDHVFPLTGYYKGLYESLSATSDITELLPLWLKQASALGMPQDKHPLYVHFMAQCIEAMASEGWIFLKKVKGRGMLQRPSARQMMRPSSEGVEAVRTANPGTPFKVNIE